MKYYVIKNPRIFIGETDVTGSFGPVNDKSLAKEVKRCQFLGRVKGAHGKLRRLSEIAVQLGLSPELYDYHKWAPRPPAWPSTRATGRTTRMLLSAAVNVMNGEPVIVCAHNSTYARELSRRLMEWVKVLGGDARLIARPDGITPTTNIHSLRGYSQQTKFYRDHRCGWYVGGYDLPIIGYRWETNP